MIRVAQSLGAFASLVTAVAAIAGEGGSPTIEELCRTTPCSPAHAIQLRLPDGNSVKTDVPRHPVILNDNVHLFLQDRLFIEVGVEEGGGSRLRVVNSITNSSASVTLELFQDYQAGELTTFLHIKNGLPRALKYRALITTYGRLGIRPTSACPVLAGKESYEIWPGDPIVELVMTKIQLLDLPAGGTVVCE